MSKINEKYVVLGIILIMVGAVLFYGAGDIIPYSQPVSKGLYSVEAVEKAWDDRMRAINSYDDTVQAVTFLGIIMGLVGLILLVIGIAVPHMGERGILDILEMEAIEEERDDKMDIVSEIIEAYNDKGYKVMKYEFEDPILKVILSKENKKYLATFDIETKKAKYELIEEEKQEE